MGELHVYRDVFTMFGFTNGVSIDNEDVRKWILANACIPADEYETTLHSAVNSDGLLAQEGFIEILRDNPLCAEDVIRDFHEFTFDGFNMEIDVCRRELLKCTENAMGMRLEEAEHSASILESIIPSLGKLVSIDNWLRCCKRVARVIRLAYGCGVC